MHKTHKTWANAKLLTLLTSSFPISTPPKEQRILAVWVLCISLGHGQGEDFKASCSANPEATSVLLKGSTALCLWQSTRCFIGKCRKPRQAVNQYQRGFFFPSKSSRSVAAHLWMSPICQGPLGFFWISFLCLFFVGFVLKIVKISVHFITELQSQQAAKGPHWPFVFLSFKTHNPAICEHRLPQNFGQIICHPYPFTCSTWKQCQTRLLPKTKHWKQS